MKNDKTLELYIHIPFCERKCRYCDFLSFPADEDTKTAYVRQLTEEIRVQAKQYEDYTVSTVFIGGGTPSILKGVQIINIMSAVFEAWRIDAGAEITIECNPGTLTKDKLEAYNVADINRISLGLQSANDKELASLGRIHTFGDFLNSYEMVRQVGFGNVNVDIMSTLPGQTLQSYKDTLRKVAMLKPEHISAYSLIIEEGTPFYDLYQTESFKNSIPDEETDREMYHMTQEELAKSGYRRYEISNYAKPGFECRHNIGYWTGENYLGLGLGASSYIMNRRFHVEKDLGKYLMIDMHRDITPLYQELTELSKEELMGEFMILGLRMTDGVSGAEFMNRFGLNMFDVYRDAIRKNHNIGLLDVEEPNVRLNEKGLDLANFVMKDFI